MLNQLEKQLEQLMNEKVPAGFSKGQETVWYLTHQSDIINLKDRIEREKFKQKVVENIESE